MVLALKDGIKFIASLMKLIIAGAGGAAHLPGMLASITCIPVIGVPVESKTPVSYTHLTLPTICSV